MQHTIRRYHAITAIALVVGFSSIALAAPKADHTKPTACASRSTTAPEFRRWSAKVWDESLWKRKSPKKTTIKAQRDKLHCAAGPGHRKAMKTIWKADRKAFYKHRKDMLWYATYRQFEYPDGSHWAVPYPIAWCESGGNYFVGPSGAYGLIPPFPQYLSPKVQDEIAYNLYEEQGEGPWAPYESGCAYR